MGCNPHLDIPDAIALPHDHNEHIWRTIDVRP
jgi:hypothetical protein